MKSVYVVWKNSYDGMWRPVAKLTRLEEGYLFNYTQGANCSGFEPFPRMNDLNKVYRSKKLFSFFSNRLIPTNRPEFRKMLDWSDLDYSEYDELDVLGISGGARKTDEFRIVKKPDITPQGLYKLRFFISGVRHLSPESLSRVSRLSKGDTLKFIFEDSNPQDEMALLVCTEDKIPIGYCPKYFNHDIRAILNNPQLASHSLKVVRLNSDAPSPFRVLCEFSTQWPVNFTPMLSQDYMNYEGLSGLLEIGQ